MLSEPLFLNPQVLLFISFTLILFYITSLNIIKKSVIVVASMSFYYFFSGPFSLLIITLLMSITFFAAKTKRKHLIVIAIIANVLGIVIAKIYIYKDINMGENTSLSWVPLGISFFVFEFVHYLIEVLRGQSPEVKFFRFVTFSYYFPTVVSGPIRRYQEFSNQITTLQRASSYNFRVGLTQIAIGFTYKFFGDQLFNLQTKMYQGVNFVGISHFAVFLFVISIRIFLDFAGYSYIAIGVSKLFGIRIPVNFRAPYLATSVISFWDRWHISLSTWVRDYLYIPLGGSRVQFSRQTINLVICMSVIGLWHGLGQRFLIWGLFHGMALTVNHAIRRSFPKIDFLPKYLVLAFKWAVTISFISLSWVFFFYDPLEAVRIIKLGVLG